ncbi:MAG: hypothetical protein AB1584_07440, partial [Pseudomonadota bacterium]
PQRVAAGRPVQVFLDNFELELLIVLRHEKTPKVGVQLLGFSSLAGRFCWWTNLPSANDT